VAYQQQRTLLVDVSYPAIFHRLMMQFRPLLLQFHLRCFILCPNDLIHGLKVDGSSHEYTCPLGSSAGMASRHQAPSCCKHYLKARAFGTSRS